MWYYNAITPRSTRYSGIVNNFLPFVRRFMACSFGAELEDILHCEAHDLVHLAVNLSLT